MNKKNVVQEKSFAFSLRIIRLYQYLTAKKKQYELPKQLLRCGTSIGANIEEALGAQSNRDFIAKISIAYKEARETHYWIRLLRDSGSLSKPEAVSILRDADELLRLLSSILITSKKKKA